MIQRTREVYLRYVLRLCTSKVKCTLGINIFSEVNEDIHVKLGKLTLRARISSSCHIEQKNTHHQFERVILISKKDDR